MDFRFVDGPMKTSQALLSHAERKVRAALARVADRVTRVEVHVVDDNGPKGGTDKRCSIIANVAGMGQFSSDRTIGQYAQTIWNVEARPRAV